MICLPDPVYIDFFKRSKDQRIIFLRGGRRSGKTYAVFYRFLFNAEHRKPRSILITSSTHPNLGKVMSDFQNITGLSPQYNQKRAEYVANVGKSLFRFKSYPTHQDAKGTDADELYINEGDGIKKDIFETLILGIKSKIIVDHNPTNKFWGTEIQTSENTLTTNYMNNSFLTQQQKDTFKQIEEVGKNAPIGSAEYKRYANQILGEYSELGGRVFHKLHFIDEKEYNEIDLIKYIGVDWGDTNDPTAAASIKFDFINRNIFIKEEFYDVRVPDSLLTEKLKIIQDVRYLIYETATGGNTRIINMLQDKELKQKIKTAPVVKQPVYSSTLELAEWTLFVCGKNAQSEFDNFKIKEGAFDGDDHIIDAVRYVFIMVCLLKLTK